MVRKRAKKGKYVFFHPACILLIFLLLTGCTFTKEFKNKWQGHEHLKMAEKFVARGDYEKALEEDENVLKIFPGGSPGDRALFHMGIIWAYPNNPQRDYKKALKCFQQFNRDFPQSALREKVSFWTSTIDELIRLESKSRDLEETVITLRKQLNTLKEIDIGIEEKKRKRLPREIER